jgi:hypothetical protein
MRTSLGGCRITRPKIAQCKLGSREAAAFRYLGRDFITDADRRPLAAKRPTPDFVGSVGHLTETGRGSWAEGICVHKCALFG